MRSDSWWARIRFQAGAGHALSAVTHGLMKMKRLLNSSEELLVRVVN